MRKIHKVLLLLCAMSLLVGTSLAWAGGTTEAKGGKQVVLGYTPLSMGIAYFNDVVIGIQMKAKEMGVKVIIKDPQLDAGKQFTAVEDLITAGANVIAICSIDIATAQSAVKYAKEKHIPVISHISKFDGADAYVSLSEYDYGFAAGKGGADYIKKNMGGNANVAILDADDLGGDLLLRGKGLQEGVLSGGAGIKVVARTTAWQEDKALNAMEAILKEHPEVNFVVTSNEPGAYGALAAAEAANRKDIKISAIGSEDRQLDLIAAGKIVHGIDPSPIWTGQKIVEDAVKLVRGETLDKESMVPFGNVTPDNAMKIKDDKAKAKASVGM